MWEVSLKCCLNYTCQNKFAADEFTVMIAKYGDKKLRLNTCENLVAEGEIACYDQYFHFI